MSRRRKKRQKGKVDDNRIGNRDRMTITRGTNAALA